MPGYYHLSLRDELCQLQTPALNRRAIFKNVPLGHSIFGRSK